MASKALSTSCSMPGACTSVVPPSSSVISFHPRSVSSCLSGVLVLRLLLLLFLSRVLGLVLPHLPPAIEAEGPAPERADDVPDARHDGACACADGAAGSHVGERALALAELLLERLGEA